MRGDSTICTLDFTPQQPPLSELHISGEFLDRAVLASSNGYTVVLAEPRGPVRIPQGDYTLIAAWLKKGPVEAFRTFNQPVSVKAPSASSLLLGGPLTNSVSLARHRKDLVLAYSLLGADGGSYRLAQQDAEKPPEFTIWRGGAKVDSGKFRYG